MPAPGWRKSVAVTCGVLSQSISANLDVFQAPSGKFNDGPGFFNVIVSRMKLTSSNRSFVAWALYFCVLFNVFACGLGHGQMTGLELNGVGGQFCSSLGNKQASHHTEFTDQSVSSWSGSLSCPMCSAATLSVVFLFYLIGLLSVRQVPRPRRELRCKAPPRYSWPSANPRASPQVQACQWPADRAVAHFRSSVFAWSPL